MHTTYLLVFAGATLQSCFSTVLCLCCGVPFAHLFYRYEFPFRRFLLTCTPFFFIMPSRLAALAIQSLYGCTGLTGIVTTHFFLNMPFVFFAVTMAYRSSDYTLQLAARDLGATGWRCYKDIILPYLVPAIASSACVVALLCFSSHTIPRIFGHELYHSTPDIMLADAYQNNEYTLSWVYALMRLCVVLPISMIQAPSKHYRSSASHRRQRLSCNSWQQCCWIFFLIVAICSMYVPLIALLTTCVNQSVLTFWHSLCVSTYDPLLGCTVSQAILMSLAIAVVSSCLALGISIVLCLVQLHNKQSRTRHNSSSFESKNPSCQTFFETSLQPTQPLNLGDSIASSNKFHTKRTPRVIPVQTGVQTKTCIQLNAVRYSMTRMQKWLTQISLVNACITVSVALPFLLGGVGCGIVCLCVAQHTNTSGMLLAIGCHTAFNYPYAYRILRARAQQYDAAWTLSAMSLGATPWQAFWTIELPFLSHAMWRALCIAAGLSLVEVGAEGILAHKSIMTLPIAIRLYREHGLHNQVLGLSLITCFCVWLGAYCMLQD